MAEPRKYVRLKDLNGRLGFSTVVIRTVAILAGVPVSFCTPLGGHIVALEDLPRLEAAVHDFRRKREAREQADRDERRALRRVAVPVPA